MSDPKVMWVRQARLALLDQQAPSDQRALPDLRAPWGPSVPLAQPDRKVTSAPQAPPGRRD